MNLNKSGVAYVHAVRAAETDPKVRGLLARLDTVGATYENLKKSTMNREEIKRELQTIIDAAAAEYFDSCQAEAETIAGEIQKRAGEWERKHADPAAEQLRISRMKARISAMDDSELQHTAQEFLSSPEVTPRPAEEHDLIAGELKARKFESFATYKHKLKNINYTEPYITDTEGQALAGKFKALTEQPFGMFAAELDGKRVNFKIESLIEGGNEGND